MNESNQTALVILAAGKSERMGFPKGLLLIDGEKMLQRQINFYLKTKLGPIYVVLGSHAERYKEEINFEQVNVIVNSDYESGMFSSVLCGLRQIKTSNSFVIPQDCALENESIYSQLQNASITNTNEVIIPTFQEKRGHPIWLSRHAIEKILTYDKSHRLDQIINSMTIMHLPTETSCILQNVNSINRWN